MCLLTCPLWLRIQTPRPSRGKPKISVLRNTTSNIPSHCSVARINFLLLGGYKPPRSPPRTDPCSRQGLRVLKLWGIFPQGLLARLKIFREVIMDSLTQGSSGPPEYMQSVLHNLEIDILSTCRQIPQKFKLFGRLVLRFKSSTSGLFLIFNDFRAWEEYWLIIK